MITNLPSKRRGVALVIVLAILMLLSALLVAFMGKVGTERAASRSIAQSFEAKQAYDSAVNLVMSQIREATRNTGDTAWASQPGAIRVFGDNAWRPDDAKAFVYKLYSSDRMKVKESDYDPTLPLESGLEGNRSKTPDGFDGPDLNDPIMVPIPNDNTGLVEPHYPIVSPYAAREADGEPLKTGKKPGQGVVQGFIAGSVDHPSGLKTKFGNNAARTVLSFPMRDKWLYQLKDGTMVTSVGGKIAGASQKNPPVARVAFWTDDESSKVNVNTAGENTFWDTPRASCRQEAGHVDTSGNVMEGPPSSLALAALQPATREYQRFPGHPATTSLSPVLRWLAPNLNDVNFKEAIYRLAPRYMGGTGGSVSATQSPEFFSDFRITDKDRLFATLDEYWFRPDRSPISLAGMYKVFRMNSAATVADNLYASGAVNGFNISPEAMERTRFFLTATSRAPELNLWGKPRICIWPIHASDSTSPATSKRSVYDDLIAFCSTVAKKQYYFTRSNPWSTKEDFELINNGRNQKLVDNYLRELTRKNVPGMGKSFDAKYGETVSGSYKKIDQILLSIYDYIRSVNLVDTGRKDTSSSGFKMAYTAPYSTLSGTGPSATTPSTAYDGSRKSIQGSAQVIPTVRGNASNGIKGYGRFVTPSEIGLLFMFDTNVIQNFDDPPPKQANGTAGVAGVHYVPVRCILLTEMFTISPYYPALSEAYAYKVSDNSLGIGSSLGWRLSLSLGSEYPNYVEVDPWRVGYGRFFMPTRGMDNQFVYDGVAPSGSGAVPKPKILKKTAVTPSEAYSVYPFFSKIIYFPQENGVLPQHFRMDAGTITYEIYPLDIKDPQNPGAMPKLKSELIQKITVKIPAAELPMPTPGKQWNQRALDAINRARQDSGTAFWFVTTNDVVRSVEAVGAPKGDLRMVAGLVDVPDNFYAPSGAPGSYNDRMKPRVHNFRQSWGRLFPEAVGGLLTRNNAPRDKRPKVGYTVAPAGMAIAPSDGSATGDFDRGVSKHIDGPFINNPDEGNTRFNMSDDYSGGGYMPYFRGGNGYEEVGQTYFSPNRLIASAVMFGSLPTGISPTSPRPWETLLFCPEATTGHRGAQSPHDHYLLDLFHMPVVEPYAISEPLSTGGKINLNCRLAPYGYVKDPNKRGYIERNTGIHAVLKDLKQLAVPSNEPQNAHAESPRTGTNQGGIYRFEINALDMMEKVINPYLDNKAEHPFFRSASQICELDLPFVSTNPGMPNGGALVPGTSPSFAARKAFWEANNITGDNMRERLYAHIYPRITTKSNVFTVHIWAQSLSKNPNTPESDWDKFSEKTDRITGEYRGSTTIERYIDPNDEELVRILYDAANPGSTDLERYYRFRILNSKRFSAN
jgi:uncharacterized protein (TIGR02600 family)